MELRAIADTVVSEDLTSPLPPLAAVLHHHFLPRRCSSCFRSLSTSNLLRCCTCDSSLQYCSQPCLAADLPRHVRSGECTLFNLSPLCSADLRLALRLLDVRSPYLPRRIAGLSTAGLDEVLKQSSDLVTELKNGAKLMATVVNKDEIGEELMVAVLWAVMTNAVEVEIGGVVGIAVYGPKFSWINHSCVPNACYRFEFAELTPSDVEEIRVYPTGNLDFDAVMKMWSYEEFVTFGPRVVVRSIKPITRGEEVSITYIDLLQPKVVRQKELLSKYQFVCCCSLCTTTPRAHIDYLLTQTASGCQSEISSSDDELKDSARFADYLDDAIGEYITDGDPVHFCNKVEALLYESIQDYQCHAAKYSEMKFKLYPLHHLSLNGYVSLASTYKASARVSQEKNSGNSEMWRAAAAYALLLAGATNYLFMCESSLIATAALHWINAGEALLDLVRLLIHTNKEMTGSCLLLSQDLSWSAVTSTSIEELKNSSMQFLESISNILLESWSFLVHGFPYMERIKSPLDFDWVGVGTVSPQFLSVTAAYDHEKQRISDSATVMTLSRKQQKTGLFLLGTHCLSYGSYLASICYGPNCSLIRHARNLRCVF